MPVLIHHNTQGYQYKLNFAQPEKNKYHKKHFSRIKQFDMKRFFYEISSDHFTLRVKVN